MANIYQLWDNTVLNSANATPEQLEQKRNELKTRFESIAREKGVASKDIYATIDKFDQYSRQKTTTRDDGLTPDEREAAQDDGSTILGLNKGALKAGARGAGDALLGIASSVPRVVGDLAQTWSDVGDNDPSELSAQLARKAYDASHDIRSNYSESTKKAKKDFWSPTGLAMGLGENLGQVALSAGLVGGASKGAMALSKGSKAWGLGAGLTTGMGLAYGQGYGQGKENALEKINNTSNEDLYANVVAEFDDWQKSGAKKSSKPEIVSLYEEAEGDLDTMKDLMAENAGNLTGLLTTATAPIAMGATAFMNRGAINEMAKQGTGNIITRNLAFQTGARDAAEFARRVAARDAATGLGGKIAANASIARQGLKIAGKQSGLQTVEEGAQEWGEGYFAAGAGSLARGDKGVLSDKDWDEVNQQGLQGAAIGALMGGGGSLLTMRDAQNNGVTQAKARTELPKQYQDAFNAFEDAKQAEAQAQAAHEANPTPESEDALNEAINERARANNQFNQYDAAFKQSFTEQEQQDLLANSLSGIAARAKLAEEAKQAELNSKAQQEALVKAQRDNLVKSLAAYADNEEVLLNEVNQLGLDDTQKELLLREVFAERKNAKDKPQQTNGQPKTPLELAVDEHFDAKGNRKPSVMSPDIADKHKVSLDELLSAIAKRNNDIKIQKAQAEKQAKVDAFNKSQAQQKTKDIQREQLTEKQQLENTLADFAAENDTDSMLSMLEGYDKTEADKLFNNAFKTVETRAKEADKATKAKEAETAKQEQAKQKQSAFSADMSALYESNPNATYNDWKAIGKKHGVTSAIDLASAWASLTSKKPVKNQEQANPTKPLALPAPNNVMVTDAQGNTTQTTENNVPKKQRNADVSVPSGLKVDVSNTANTQRDRGVGSYIGNAYIVRQDGKPFPTEQVAQQALENKATKKTKPKKNEPVITKDTHTVVPVDGGFAIAPVEAVTQKQVNTQADDTLVSTPQTTPKTDADQIRTIGSKEDGLIASKFREDLKSFLTKIDEIDVYENEPSDLHKFSTFLTNEILQKRAENQDDLKGFISKSLDLALDESNYIGLEGAFNDRSRINAVEEFLYKKAKSTESLSFENKEKEYSKTEKEHSKSNGQQIAQAMDKTAKAITDAAHSKVGSEPVVTKEIKQPKQANKTVNTENDDLLTAIAKLGGLSREESVKKFGIDPAQTNIRKAGLLPVFRKNGGLSFDDMAKTLYGYGYPVSDNGQYSSPNALYDALDESLRGREVGTSEYHEKRMEQRYAERMKEEAEFEAKLSQAGSSTWDEAENMESVVDAIAAEIINNESAINKDQIATTTKEVENVSDSTGSRQDNDTTAKTQSVKNGDTEVAGLGKAGQQESKSSTGKDTQPQGIQGLQGLTLTAQTEESRRKEEEQAKAAETKRQAEEKAAKDKAQADKELNDFRLTGSNAPADIAMAGGQKDMFAPPTRGEREKAKGFTENQKPTKPFSAPSENLPEKTIMRFLNDGELENAYFFAENQQKPIRFALNNKKEPIAYFLTEPVDLGNNITSFVGILAYPMSKSNRWLVLEEKSRTSIGFEEISKQAAIRSAKARLSALKKDDLERILSNIKPINKTDEEMKADWLAKNNIKTEEQSNEQNSINRKTKNLAKAEAQATPTRGERAAEKAKTEQPELKKGEVGYKFSSGEVVLTATGRETTPFPKVDLSTNRKATNSHKVIESWLMDNAIAEAKARGDKFNLLQFNASRNKPQQADKDSAEMYLFDSRSVQPIPAPFMRQLVAGTTEPTPTKQPQPVVAEQDKPIKKTPIQGKDIWMEVEFIAGNKSKELFYHNRMTDPNKPFNTEAEAIADWESKTEEQSKEQSNEENSIKSTKPESIIKVKFPLEETVNAWQHSVRNPSEIAKSFRKDFEDFIEDAYNSALLQAETDLQKKALEQASLKLQQDYIKRFNELNAARSGVTSSFIAGRNNFNGKQAESRGNAFDKVSQRFDNWLLESKYALATAVQDARSPEQLAKIKAEKDAKEQKLQDKNDEFLRKVLDFKKGDDFTVGKNQYKVVRVNRNKDGMPISLTLEGEGLIKGIDDKISLFGRGMAYPTINDLREAVTRVQEKDESELIPKKSDNEDLQKQLDEKAKNAEKEAKSRAEIEGMGKVVQSAPQDRPTDYRTNLESARDVAKSLGLETKEVIKQNNLKGISENGHYASLTFSDEKQKFVKTTIYLENKDLPKNGDYIVVTYEIDKRRKDPKSIGGVVDYGGDYDKILDVYANDNVNKYGYSLLQRGTISKRLKKEIADLEAEKESKADADIQSEQAESTPTVTQATEIEPSQKLKDMIELSKKRVHSVGQAIVDEHHFLAIGTSALTGQPIYALFNDDGRYFVVDIDSAKSNAAFSQEVIDKAKAVKQKLEQQDADFVKKYPDGVFSGTDAQVVSSESVSKKVTAYLDSLLKMLGIETRVFLATQKDINAADAQAKYHIYGGHRSILSVQISTEESGVTRIIGINQKDSKDAYIAFNSDMSEEEMIEVVAHEVGHIIEKTLLRNAPKETQEAIKADFEKWLASVKGITKKEHLALMRNRHIAERDMQNKADIMDTPNTNLSSYWFSFSEWFADNVSRWATTSEKPLSLVEKFFAKVAKKLKQLVHIIQESKDSYKPSVSVRDYLDSIVRTDFTNELYNDEDFNADSLEQSDNQDTDSKPKFSQSSTISDRTITQVRDKLISRFGKRIIELLESKGILKIHQSMSDKDIPAEALRSIKAYHGSPAMFDKFMSEFVNSGEGAQAFGWGHYLAGRKALGEWYRTVLSNDFNRTSFVFRKDGERVRLTDLYTPKSEWEKVNEDKLVELFKKYLLGKQSARGGKWQVDTDPRYDALAEIAKDLSQYNKDTLGYTELKAVQQVMQKYKSKQFSAQRVSTAHNKTGQLYEVDIAAKEESFLDWFTKFDDLSPAEQKSLAKVFKEFDAYGDLDTTDKTIGQLYQKVTRYSRDGTPKRLSLALQDLGYSGIKFLDQESRKNPYEKQYFNYVVFDENIISIKDTYYSAQQGVTEGFYFNGTIHLIADNLTDETIIPTFVHELGGHKGFQEMMSPKAYELIMQQFDRLVAQGNAIAIKAKQRAEKAEKDTARQQDEYIPYLLTEQEKAQFATPQERNAVKRLIDHILRAVKGWVVRTLSKYNGTAGIAKRVSETLDARDIQLMAERMIKDIAKRGGDNNNSPKFSKTEQSQFDRLLAKADKMIAEQGKLLAPNGKPSKLNRVQWAQVRTDNFKAWFGDWENDPANASKAVDDNGEPLVVYHGSGQEFYIFDKKKATDSEGRKYGVGTGKGVFSFTENNDIASNWANRAKNRAEYGVKSDMPTVISAFLNIKRPITRNEFESMLDEKFIGYDFRLPKIRDKFISEIYTELKKKKIDGIMSDFGEITAFYPTQIKSAISNNGEFSPTNPDIRFSRAEDKAKADKMIAEQGKLLAPNGKPSKLNRVQWAQVRTDNFKAWFGDWENDPENASKVVDENGEPLVVYRADTELYNKFDKRKARQGFFFTSSRKATELYNGDVRDFFLSIKNPLVTLNALPNEKNIIDLKNTNFDGVHNQGVYGADEFIVATSTQIKSATDNNGEFSPTNPDIRFSRAEDKAKAAKDYVLDSVRIKKEVAANLNAKKELGWWHKTLGTQQNTAIQHKDFGRVYKTLQRLLQHQSSDVTDALEVAPTLLEKLDDWKDFKNQAKSIGRNISQGVKHKLTDAITDRMAVAKVIFGETLAKKALTQDELEQKLNSQQLSMYEEARAAINVSLKNTAMSEIIRSLLQADAINFDTVEKHLNQQTGFDEFVDEMLENVGARISNAQAELSQATDKKQQKAIKEEIARLSDMYNSISNVNNKVYQLIDEAYAPLMRFGDYALTMRDKTTGKVLSFMMFESKAERNRMVNYLGTEYGNTVDLETDTMSTEDFKQFKGVTPETVALFAKELGLDKNEAYQGYLKLAIPATSALTRRIQRKGTAGFNEDIQRVLASFVMSNARYSAKNIYLAKADKEISEIESGASVRDQAKKMRDNTIDPVDTFAWLRDLLFVWNLGGSVMFAFLNMTQPFMQTIPMLSQYVNTSFATKHVLRGIGVAGKAMATGNAPKGYEAEYKRAVHEGIVDPQNTFMLTGLERGGTGTTSKVWTGTKHILGLFAQMSESLNRKATFIAALEVANAKGGAWLKQKGYASAYDFAVDVISQTQGVYNKANRSNWAHSPVGAPLLVFKQFSINYVEQIVRMAKNNTEGEEGKKAVLLMLFMLFSLAGGMGLPFIKDIFDGSETIAAFMGNPVNIEREMRLMGKEYFGETTTGALMDGWLNKLVIGEVLGADVQSRTGMGDLIPWTNFFNKTIYGTDQQVSEGMSIFGAAGGLGEKVVDSFNFMANNEWGNAFINILPRFATSMYRGVEMMTTDETTDSKGRKLFDTTLGEGLVKFFDAQPVRMAELSRARGLEYDDIAIQSSKIKYFKNKWVKAAQKEDMEAIEQIEEDIQEWNENNEKYPVIFDRKRAYQTANKNDMTWGEREAKPPRGMEWLKEERPEM